MFFDLVGTLVGARTSIGTQYASFARRFGAAQADPLRLGAAFGEAMRLSPPMAFSGRSAGEVAAQEREWWRRVVLDIVARAGLGGVLTGAKFDGFFASLYEHFTTADAWEAYPDVVPALVRLRARGLGLGLITNYDTRVYRLLDALDLTPLLDSVTIPAEAGAAKPSPAIFRHALQAHQVDAGAAAFVGDELEDDYLGATSAGMAGILLDREDRHRGEALTRIRTLDELS